MRFVVLLAAIAAPALAAASETHVVAQPLEHFSTITPAVTQTADGLLIEGGYCRQARYAARPQNVRIVRMDAAGEKRASQTARLLGATGNRSQGCGYYAARAEWALSQGEKIEVQPSVR